MSTSSRIEGGALADRIPMLPRHLDREWAERVGSVEQAVDRPDQTGPEPRAVEESAGGSNSRLIEVGRDVQFQVKLVEQNRVVHGVLRNQGRGSGSVKQSDGGRLKVSKSVSRDSKQVPFSRAHFDPTR